MHNNNKKALTSVIGFDINGLGMLESRKHHQIWECENEL